MKKDSFIIYNAFYEPIKKMTDEQLGKLFRSLFNYSISQKTDIDNDIQMAFLFFKNQMDIDGKKYAEKCKKRSEAGKKGMENRWKNDITNDNKNNKCYQKITNVTNITDNENDNDNDNVNENVNENVNDNDNIYEYVEKNYGRTLSTIEIEKIQLWSSLYSNQIIKKAVEISVLNDKKTFNYVNGILNNWKTNNYKTLEDIEKNKVNEPDWFNKDIKKEQASKEEQEELKEILKSYE